MVVLEVGCCTEINLTHTLTCNSLQENEVEAVAPGFPEEVSKHTVCHLFFGF